jgi:hypothetical protein
VEDVPWNLAQYSEDFSNAVWTLANVTVTANDITAPNGTLTADKFTISVNGCDVKQTISVLPNTVYTWSFYVYGGTALGQQGRFYDNTNLTNIEYYNYSSSVVLGAWVKIERTFTTPSGCYEIQAWVLAATSTIGTMWAWGCQLNIGSTAKPYFPTTDRLNVPRLTYQNGGGGCPSLLLEKQSTNLALYSEQFDNAAWVTFRSSISANNTTSPDGTQNADKIIQQASTTDSGGIYQNLSLSNSTVYTYSVYLKAAGYNFGLVRVDGGQYAWFDLSNGVVGSITGSGSSSIQNMGNGWYRCIFTFTTTSTLGEPHIYVAQTNGSAIVSSADGVKGIFAWGAQLEASSYPTSYIPTTSASATRVADTCSKTGISSLIGQTEGVLFIDYNYDAKPDVNGNLPMVIYDGSNEAYIFITGGGDLRLELYNGGVLQCLLTTSIGAVGRKKIAFAYKQNDFVGYMNGVQVATDTSGTVASMSNLYVGSYYTANYNANGGINQALLFKTRLSNSDLIALTTL